MNFIDPLAKVTVEPTRHYLVVHCRDTWWVDCDGKAFGPCASKEAAIHSAQKLISIFEDPARRAEIWAPDEGGRTKLMWKRTPAGEINCATEAWTVPADQRNFQEHIQF